MGRQIGVVGVSQVGYARRPIHAERGPRSGAQFGAGHHGSVVGETDQARIEGRIPNRGEE
jgi:hypothetical protein